MSAVLGQTVIDPNDLTQGIQATAPGVAPNQVIDVTTQYLRKLSIVVSRSDSGAGIDFADFKVEFQVCRGDSQTPNSCDARIYNLNNDTAAMLRQPEFDTLTVQAGYEGNFGIIFVGDIKQTRKGRIDGKDSYVDITAADGDQAYCFAAAALSFAKDKSQLSHIKGLIQTMAAFGVSSKTDLPPLTQSDGIRGTVYYGQTRDLLRQFAAQNDCVWSIQDGAVVLIPQTSPIPGGSIPLISPASGLIGTPEQTANGIEMRVLLNPFLRIGQVIKLDTSVTVNSLRAGLDLESGITNPQIFGNLSDPNRHVDINGSAHLNGDGLYYVMQANHTGDTRGEPWWTDITCLAVDATVPQNVEQYTPVAPQLAGSILRY